MENQLDKLTTLGTEAVQSAIENYTHWYTANALCGLIFTVILLLLGLIFLCSAYRRDDDDLILPAWGGLFIAFFISGLIVNYDLPNLLHPKAAAIHKLLTDATGKGS